jgi:hypothetical protein
MHFKTQLTGIAYIISLGAAFGATAPGDPSANGLLPKSDTLYVNRLSPDSTAVNNGNTESLGVAIANGGNIIVGWEDDGDEVSDQEGVWTMFDSAGLSITPDIDTTSIFLNATLSSHFLSYFRPDKSAVFGGTSWGPKIKANPFGDGLGMGATSYGLGEEIVAFAPYDDANSGDFSSLQLLSNTGQPVTILGGITPTYATADSGNIRVGDWEFLSNGNVIIASESRQKDDLVNLYGGDTPNNHAIFRVLDKSGTVIKAETLASEVPVISEMWHGVGVTKDGFAIRFGGPAGATVRLFNNAGQPLSTNIELANLTGFPLAGTGGRGDSSGFHGNGKDAYVITGSGNDSTDGLDKVWLTVLGTNGTVRFSKSVSDDLTLNSIAATDAAIDADGNVVVVYTAKYDPDAPNRVAMGRRFDATGKPIGGTFFLSELEGPDAPAGEVGGGRVAWRNGQVVAIWESKNDAQTVNSDTGEPLTVVAMRIFSTFAPGTVESVGLTRIVPDTAVIKPDANSLGNWEPYASVLGTSTFLVEGNTFADDGTDLNQRYVVALQPAAGGAMKLGDGFYTDDGQPFKGQINLSRQNGNPGRVAGDTRPGAVNFVVGGETSVHAVPGFNSGNRWNLGFDRLSDGRFGTVESFQLNTATLTQTPLSKALDSAYGRLTSGQAAGNQISRFGGDIVFLDNGNYVSVVEDRSRVYNADGNAVVATIFAPNGTVVKEAFIVAPTTDATARDVDIWSNVAPFKGGFAVRTKTDDGASRAIYFFDNNGVLKGTTDQATSGASFDTGRGDGTRIFGHINSPIVYLTGRAANTKIVKVAAFDSRTQQFAAISDVNEGAFTGDFDRAIGAVDALNRLTVSWVSQPSGYAKQQVAARILSYNTTNKTFSALTPSFLPFINAATNDITTFGMTVAMTTRQICVAAKGSINYANKPNLGPDSPTEVNLYTVFSHPVPTDDPTTPAVTVAPVLHAALTGGNLVLSWDAGATGFTLESKSSLSDASWTTVGTSNPATITLGSAAKFYRLRQ